MDHGKGLSELIYEYLKMRLYFQYFKNGEKLPSVDTLCRTFSVVPQTVQAALKKLSDEGAVSLHRGRCAIVTLNKSKEEFDAWSQLFFSQRKNTFADLYCSVELVFMPLLIKEFCRMDEKDFALLTRLARRAKSEDLIRFYCFILQKAENPLVMNLFWENCLFLGVPYVREGAPLYQLDLIRRQLLELIAFARTSNTDRIFETQLVFQDVSKNLTQYFSEQIQSAPQSGQISFVWHIYRKRTQIRYNLAMRILHEICSGEYHDGQLLMSYQKLAEQYGVSVITIRRTIDMTNQLGVTNTVNGLGTYVVSKAADICEPEFNSPAIRRNIAIFFQAYELLAFSSAEVFQAMIPTFTAGEKGELAALLQNLYDNGRCVFSLETCVSFIAAHAHLQSIREIYSKLYGLILWGYPIMAICENALETAEHNLQFTHMMIQELTSVDLKGIAAAVHKLTNQELNVIKNYLLKRGFTLDELRLSAQFRLFPTELED